MKNYGPVIIEIMAHFILTQGYSETQKFKKVLPPVSKIEVKMCCCCLRPVANAVSSLLPGTVLVILSLWKWKSSTTMTVRGTENPTHFHNSLQIIGADVIFLLFFGRGSGDVSQYGAFPQPLYYIWAMPVAEAIANHHSQDSILSLFSVLYYFLHWLVVQRTWLLPLLGLKNFLWALM